MRQDDEEFSRKSATYRKAHMQAIKGLYGEKQDIPVKPITKRKVKRKPLPDPEYIIQIKLVAWAKSKGLDLTSIPNAGRRSPWRESRPGERGRRAR